MAKFGLSYMLDDARIVKLSMSPEAAYKKNPDAFKDILDDMVEIYKKHNSQVKQLELFEN